MKNIVTVSLLFSWALTTAILTAGLLFRDRSTASLHAPGGAVELTRLELARHNGMNDCWLLVDGNVYDVTSYIVAHPGGEAMITPFCGKDASIAFRTRGDTGGHTSAAQQTLETFKLGVLAD